MGPEPLVSREPGPGPRWACQVISPPGFPGADDEGGPHVSPGGQHRPSGQKGTGLGVAESPLRFWGTVPSGVLGRGQLIPCDPKMAHSLRSPRCPASTLSPPFPAQTETQPGVGCSLSRLGNICSVTSCGLPAAHTTLLATAARLPTASQALGLPRCPL